jgi:hypothetical protein
MGAPAAVIDLGQGGTPPLVSPQQPERDARRR